MFGYRGCNSPIIIVVIDNNGTNSHSNSAVLRAIVCTNGIIRIGEGSWANPTVTSASTLLMILYVCCFSPHIFSPLIRKRKNGCIWYHNSLFCPTSRNIAYYTLSVLSTWCMYVLCLPKAWRGQITWWNAGVFFYESAPLPPDIKPLYSADWRIVHPAWHIYSMSSPNSMIVEYGNTLYQVLFVVAIASQSVTVIPGMNKKRLRANVALCPAGRVYRLGAGVAAHVVPLDSSLI